MSLSNACVSQVLLRAHTLPDVAGTLELHQRCSSRCWPHYWPCLYPCGISIVGYLDNLLSRHYSLHGSWTSRNDTKTDSSVRVTGPSFGHISGKSVSSTDFTIAGSSSLQSRSCLTLHIPWESKVWWLASSEAVPLPSFTPELYIIKFFCHKVNQVCGFVWHWEPGSSWLDACRTPACRPVEKSRAAVSAGNLVIRVSSHNQQLGTLGDCAISEALGPVSQIGDTKCRHPASTANWTE